MEQCTFLLWATRLCYHRNLNFSVAYRTAETIQRIDAVYHMAIREEHLPRWSIQLMRIRFLSLRYPKTLRSIYLVSLTKLLARTTLSYTLPSPTHGSHCGFYSLITPSHSQLSLTHGSLSVITLSHTQLYHTKPAMP